MLRYSKLLFMMVFLSASCGGEPVARAQENNADPQIEIDDQDSEVKEETENTPDENAASDAGPGIEEVELPEISYDLDALPFPTRRMHELILEATRAGDIEKLRAYIGTGDNMTLLSLGGFDGDPIEFLKQQSGDKEGHELLAILEEVLEAGYVRLDPDTERELYVWPYFFAMPINKLSDRQMVELFRIVTYGDFQDMEDFGGYIFYRVGITPTGRWQFFVAGD
ncbi:MAG: hypothetical protein AAGA76_09485 [Pseudomonadota bacterium]